MDKPIKIAFVGTSRSGLGHLRRVSTIARQLRTVDPHVDLLLVSNAPLDGLAPEDLASYGNFLICPRADMAGCLAEERVDLAVLDTLRMPGISKYPGKTALILRETPDARIEDFLRDDGKAWDLVIVPNPADHWLPNVDPGFARSVEAAGWILRPTGPRGPTDVAAGIVVATGGGGTDETRAALYPMLDAVISIARARASRPFRVRQAMGPRSGGAALSETNEFFDPGGDLNSFFRAADVVISTAGYNSVLELASTDTPALLAAIPRSLDDQAARVRLWGDKLGHGLDPRSPETAAEWLAGQIDSPGRRKPVDLGPDGAVRAAELIQTLL